MAIPIITRALPERRYQYGEFIVTVLGDIESGDARRYRYLLAVAQEGDPRPGLFVFSETAAEGNFNLGVAMADGEQIVASAPAFGDLELFVREALGVIGTMLNLEDEMPHRLG